MKRVLYMFKPAPHIERLPQKHVAAKYTKMQRQVFTGIFTGYIGFYFLRNNFSFAMPYLQLEGYSKTTLGLIFSMLTLAYGISKFVMGSVSDRSNPRYFMVTGLIISTVVTFLFGTNAVLNFVPAMFILMFINGWGQGMGWPASARVLVHWFSKKERGTKTAFWGTAVNIGGGLVAQLATLGIIIFSSWHSVFYFPAIITTIIAVFVLLTVRDTPQSEGLPAIEEHESEGCEDVIENKKYDKKKEKELSTKEILFKYVFVNKYLWFLSMANIFIFIIRYGVINWAPTYLTQVKDFTQASSGWAYTLFEFAAIPGTILAGWISDKFFRTRRTLVTIIFMVFVTAGVFAYWLVPPGYQLYDYITLLSVGFFIYGPLLLVSVVAMDVVPKKAAGTAVGLTGLFGYLGAVIANAGMGFAVDTFSWNGGFTLLLVSCGLAIFFLMLTLPLRT